MSHEVAKSAGTVEIVSRSRAKPTARGYSGSEADKETCFFLEVEERHHRMSGGDSSPLPSFLFLGAKIVRTDAYRFTLCRKVEMTTASKDNKGDFAEFLFVLW